jgi:hypothetical protein
VGKLIRQRREALMKRHHQSLLVLLTALGALLALGLAGVLASGHYLRAQWDASVQHVALTVADALDLRSPSIVLAALGLNRIARHRPPGCRRARPWRIMPASAAERAGAPTSKRERRAA